MTPWIRVSRVSRNGVTSLLRAVYLWDRTPSGTVGRTPSHSHRTESGALLLCESCVRRCAVNTLLVVTCNLELMSK